MRASGIDLRRSTRPIAGSGVVLVLLLSSACGSDNDSSRPLSDDTGTPDLPGLMLGELTDATGNDRSSVWFVNTNWFRRIGVRPVFYANLTEYPTPLSASDTVDFYLPELDRCEFGDVAAEGNGDADDSGPPPTISGGEFVVVNTGSGPWLIAPQLIEDDGSIYYETRGIDSSPMPADATLSVPGAAFPTISAFPLFEPDPPVRLAPDAGAVTAVTDPEFRWVPGSTNTSITIELMTFDDNGEFLGFAVTCDVADDGRFTLPPNVIDAIASSDDTWIARLERVAVRIEFVDGVLFHQRTQTAESRESSGQNVAFPTSP